MTARPLAHDLWDELGGLHLDAVPDDPRTVARQCVLDWFACAVAGSAEPVATLLTEELGADAGAVTLIASGRRAPLGAGALINGAAGHALDFDDTHTTMGGHPTVPVLPAVLALAEAERRSGADVVTALVVGIETEARLGAAIGGAHYQRGWHQTSTIGTLGAAAACSWLLGLDHDRFGHALGLAASQAAGVKANFGTMAKPFHAGQAAERGLLAARLAARGVTAAPAAFEAEQGLAAAASDGVRRERAEALAGTWQVRDVLFKYHAACYLTHAAIETAGRVDADAADVDAVRLQVHPSILKVCGIPEPRTGLEAKFSLRATTALALLGYDTADPTLFRDDLVTSPDVVAVRDRIDVVPDPAVAPTATVATYVTGDGTVEHRHDTGVPADDLGAQQSRLDAKFDALVRPVIGDGCPRLAGLLLDIEAAPDIRAVVAETV